MTVRGSPAAQGAHSTLFLPSSTHLLLEISAGLLVVTVGTCQYQPEGVGWPQKMERPLTWPASVGPLAHHENPILGLGLPHQHSHPSA